MFCRRPLLLSVVLLVVPVSAFGGEPFRYPEGKHDKGCLKYINGLPVLTVEGTPEQIGEQAAILAVKPAQKLLSYPKDLLRRLGLEKAWPVLVQTGNGMVAQFPTDYKNEMEAAVK